MVFFFNLELKEKYLKKKKTLKKSSSLSFLYLFHPVPALRQQIFVFDFSSQRNKEV